MPLPKENLDNKPFPELFRESVVRIPACAPEWTDHNLHDPGITFIELFAWLTDAQFYRLNGVGDRHWRKFLKLAGVPRLLSARAAEVELSFKLVDPQMPIKVSAGTMVAVPGSAGDPTETELAGEEGEDHRSEEIVFSTQKDLTVVGAELVKVLSRKKSAKDAKKEFTDNTEANETTHMHYHAFGPDPEAPEVGDELYLGFDKDLAGRKISLYVFLAGDAPMPPEPAQGPSHSVRLAWETFGPTEWTNLAVEDETGCMTWSGEVRLTVPGDMAKTTVDVFEAFWIRCRIVGTVEYPLPCLGKPDDLAVLYETPPMINHIMLNTVAAVHQSGPMYKSARGTGLPNQVVRLKRHPVLDGALSVKVGAEIWTMVEDLDASAPSDRHYVGDLVEGRISFGDGERGAIPPEGILIQIHYWTGGGSRGNVKEGTLTKLSSELAGILQVVNERAAVGGTDPEAIPQAMVRVRRDLGDVSRAVTAEDFEILARRTPGVAVARAKALPRYHPIHNMEIPGIISVIVVPQSSSPQPRPGIGFLRAVYRHLQRYRLLGTEVFVLPPDYKGVSVSVVVVRKANVDDDIVKDRVTDCLKAFLHPLRGGVERRGWPFGRPVYVSEVYQVIDGVEGVDYVEEVELSTDEDRPAPFDVAIGGHALVYLKPREDGQPAVTITVRKPADEDYV